MKLLALAACAAALLLVPSAAGARVIDSDIMTGKFLLPETEAIVAKPDHSATFEVRGSLRSPVRASIRVHCVVDGKGLVYKRVRTRRLPFRIAMPVQGRHPNYCDFSGEASSKDFHEGRLGVFIRY
jgi:hypothetical protein